DLLALDAKTGKQVWRVPNADYKTGSTMTNAPIVIKDLVIAGISGGEFGVRGRVTAYDVNTGKEVWRGYSTGPDADVKIVGDANPNYPSHRGKDLGVTTWQGDEWQHGGGTTWGWYSYDPTLNLFYYGSGNPGTWNPDQRPGDNKWSMSIWARNPDNGEVKWVYQMTPHDEWDYDGVNEMVLADLTIAGKPVKALVHFDRNGFGYVVDRTNGKVLIAQPYAHAAPNWASKIDLTTGVPVRNPQFGTTSKKNTEGICPAAIGFKDQQPSAYSPMTKLFYGTTEGWLKAVDANTGTELWKFKTPSGIIGNPMTYLGPDGKQYVAVLSGVGGWAGAGVALGISPEDPTAALGAIGAFGDYTSISNAGGTLMVFALP